jgi:hypothetical protein
MLAIPRTLLWLKTGVAGTRLCSLSLCGSGQFERDLNAIVAPSTAEPASKLLFDHRFHHEAAKTRRSIS